ncbi:hypothetical protein CBQ26_15115 [Deinococcus indicus]|uniref:eCIS core domain-containing protein n=1 Tax=Deinococcus indicus TaxID=223556 RepID=A0A246BHC7_9DEIO|nr:DUF4157 domain-containing protein [Deinococcus indicus]OWL94622.1 hypothetical protein CBQ26_15115 [Deinococcus indicus]
MTERVHQLQRKAGLPRRAAQAELPSAAESLDTQARALQRHTTRPQTAQRQVAAPALRAAALDRQEQARLEGQRGLLQRQVDALGPVAPLQRQPQPEVPARPATPGDWVTVMRARAEEVQGQPLDARAHAQFTALQRQVAQTLAQGFRTDRGEPAARYAAYGTHLATLQRHAVSAPVSRVMLGLVSPAERLPLQRAADEALQRFQAQDRAALNFDTLQTLQRQLAELDAEATQPVLQRIQAKRGGGNPLPEAVQRHLEQGLNHDLSRVRIHDDAEADKLAKGVNAIAFTTGMDIFFQAGRFNPNTRGGLELLAHEVTHTVQQSRGKVGPGVDPDAGLESEAQTMGARLAARMPAVDRPATSRRRTRPAFTPTTTFQRRAAGTPALQAPPLVSVGRVGIIKHSDGANLREQPNPQARKVTPSPVPVGTKVGVISQTSDGWSRVSLPSGLNGWLQTVRVTTDLPDPGSRLIRVAEQSTAIGVAERYYRPLIRPGQDLRYYVNVLEQVNRQRGTGAFQSGQALKAGSLLWIPGAAYAQTLAGTVQSGSITGGALARVNTAMGQSPGANIMRSVLESPQYVKEVLGEAWETVKQHWPVILATTTALIGAELLVGALAAAPEPTTITKFLAVGLQGIITVIAGAGAVASGMAALKAGGTWLRTAWTSKGNATQIKVAAKAFLTMIAQAVLAVASAAGVRASAGRTTALRGLYTQEQLVAQIGNKATYQALMDTLVARGVKNNNAQILGNLLKKVPNPAELKGFLVKTDSPTELLSALNDYPLTSFRITLQSVDRVKVSTLITLMKKVPDPLELKLFLKKTGNPGELLSLINTYSAAAVRAGLREIDGVSIKPQFALRLLRIKLKEPIPTRRMTPAQAEFLNKPLPRLPVNPTDAQKKAYQAEMNARGAVLDSFYQGRQPTTLKNATPGQLAKDQALGLEYKALLDDILKDAQYVYRAMHSDDLKYYTAAGKIERPGYMTNVMPQDANEIAYLAQIEGRWYTKSEGLPDIVLKIPISALEQRIVPRISGNNQLLLGHELTTAAYPTAGKGGALQFLGTTSTFDPSWVIPLKAVNPGRR